MARSKRELRRIIQEIRASGLTIYDQVTTEFRFETQELEQLLDGGLQGLNLDYPIRTRSKVLKENVCKVLGYPVPAKFQRTKPRFPGQDLDTYVQKRDNLQIWNEEVCASRRYALIRVNDGHVMIRVRVVSGETVAKLDRTGTLTTKYQAKARRPVSECMLVSPEDTRPICELLACPSALAGAGIGQLRPIAELYERIEALCGREFPAPGAVQERNRGAALHHMVCAAVGDEPYDDCGQFPDIRSQLLEVKLQLSPTIDLGLVSPDSTEPVGDLPRFRHCDVRYAVCYAESDGKRVIVKSVVLSTGNDFFQYFRRFGGLVRNAKLQIPLPGGFFS